LVAATWQLAKKLEGAKGYTVLNATPFFDSDVVAVTNVFPHTRRFGHKWPKR
jgi:hypothetical protein